MKAFPWPDPSSSTSPLLHICLCDPVGIQGCDILDGIEDSQLDFAAVDDIHDVVYGDGRLGDIGGNHDLPVIGIGGPLEHRTLLVGGHLTVQGVDFGILKKETSSPSCSSTSYECHTYLESGLFCLKTFI